jgi:hypothetical protein
VIVRRPSGRKILRIVMVILPALLGCLLLAGCDEAYDVEMLYPPRSDWLVAEPLKDIGPPTRYDPPGAVPLDVLDNPHSDLFGPDQKLLLDSKVKSRVLDPRTLLTDQRALLVLALRDVGGRPRYPKIELSGDKFMVEEKGNRVHINTLMEKELKLDKKTLALGSELYRKQCLHCHGLSGDGRGPTGLWVNPHPRDYRQGIFKFTSSTQKNAKPRREDLKRVLMNGIEGTSMPSFTLLKPEEIEALVSYVIHLSIRGEAEFAVLKDLIHEKQEGTTESEAMIDRVRGKTEEIAKLWLEAQKTEIKPKKPPEYRTNEERLESVRRGYYLYQDTKKTPCAGCHLNYGRDAPFKYDTWGTIVKPRNFFSNMYRGGRRPIEIYWRIAGGINGADMAPFVDNTASISDEQDQQIWDLISFLQILPYPEKRQELKDKFKIVVE